MQSNWKLKDAKRIAMDYAEGPEVLEGVDWAAYEYKVQTWYKEKYGVDPPMQNKVVYGHNKQVVVYPEYAWDDIAEIFDWDGISNVSLP